MRKRCSWQGLLRSFTAGRKIGCSSREILEGRGISRGSTPLGKNVGVRLGRRGARRPPPHVCVCLLCACISEHAHQRKCVHLPTTGKCAHELVEPSRHPSRDFLTLFTVSPSTFRPTQHLESPCPDIFQPNWPRHPSRTWEESQVLPGSLGILCKLTWLQAHLAACSGFLCVLHLPCDVACPKPTGPPLSQTPHPQSKRLKAAGRWLFPGSVTALTVDKLKGESLDSRCPSASPASGYHFRPFLLPSEPGLKAPLPSRTLLSDMCAYNFSTWGLEARSEIQGHPWLQEPCLKTTTK